jgi:SAM-dependent methyltransferase
VSDNRGDGASFDKNWGNCDEASYLHWTRDVPINQIQLAFRMHWNTFNDILRKKKGKCLEVGCGRGSLSAYFSDHGWDCTLLDLSETVIKKAKQAFIENSLDAKFDVGDCNYLPYKDNTFDLTFSIGLLEHFDNYDNVIAEQVRVLAPGGMFIGYVVPEMPNNIQKDFEWVNHLLRSLLPNESIKAENVKSEIYRSDVLSAPYLRSMKKYGLVECNSDGIYPLPMVSHSPSFPFSLLPEAAEKSLVKTFNNWMLSSDKLDPWRCKEGYGQAFIVWGVKPG